MEQDDPLRIAVLGANPIGLEATLYARYLGHTVHVFDSADVCAAVEVAGSQSLDGPFGEHCSPLGLAALAAHDPNCALPMATQIQTGRQWLDDYLLPLSRTDLVADSLRLRHKVLAIEYADTDETFEVTTSDDNGVQRCETFDYIVDTRSQARIGYGAPPDLAGQLPVFADRDVEDYFVVTAETFRESLEQIREIFATVGERDDLDVYRSFSK